ncbi:hypothetical protein BKA70DRAFT_1293479, partial [Coprinopsis sp. MPI-PUGE-AT-0042]
MARPMKPLAKRRRIESSTLPSALFVPPSNGPAKAALTSPTGMPTCAYCHRGLLAIPGGPVMCARCSALTCTVCSRTCTSSRVSRPLLCPPPSAQATPAPRRSVLALHASTNVVQRSMAPGPLVRDASLPDVQMDSASQEDYSPTSKPIPIAVAKKRRKARTAWMEQTGNLDDDGDSSEGGGCGRTICRNCCLESSKTTSCYDCPGHDNHIFLPI